MSGDIGSIGEGMADIATGGLAARALEKQAGEGADGHTHEGACLNCGAPLAGPHCHECGQRAHVHRTLSAFFHDLLHGVLHFEGKTWRTIPLLAWKPGKLTREYIDGKRASYVSPIALFLFVVFLSYALFSALGGSEAMQPSVNGMDEIKSAYTVGKTEIAELEAERKHNLDDPERLAKIDDEIGDIRTRQQGLETVLGSSGSGSGEETEDSSATENSLTRAFAKIKDNPQLAIYKLQTNAYKYSWMLIPLSVPFVWLLFPFSRRFRGYDHTVFATYSITFMIALVAAVSLLFYYGLGAIGGVLLFYAPYHMYRQLRGTYEVGRFGALWRMLLLSMFAWVAIGLFVSVIGWMAGH